MQITDRVYGAFEVDEPVLLELMACDAMQRLKGIAQFGVPDPYYHLPNYDRFEHSVGVMLVLRKLGAGLEEQMAGLLHDVSHTTFSHVIDWVVGDGASEDYQDEHHEQVIERSGIPEILKRYGFSWQQMTEYHRFGLLEREAPDLCADRLDYSLREMNLKTAKALVVKLRVKDNMIVFADAKSALLFGREYLKEQMGHWGGFEAASRYRLFADILREAIQKKVVSLEDFWQTDEVVVRKMKQSGDKSLLKQLQVLEAKSLEYLPKSEVVVHKKFRYVDPLFIDGDKLLRASDVDLKFRQELEIARKKNAEGVRVPKLAV